ncbi:esterase family protein [Mycobacterium sp. 852014-52144_SCH5372336]|uniref:esterase family protein n=1 Tax=Mycobacterium sp. 852014-52144_SCH5372336 TaxID=1834115 RepID=UPI0007FD6DD3|nr:alpha/beta hydrolase family protein [Mycobacterium sp. 852014-52144_SCH5372336]OBB70911.1 diacylglycerol acyltransferase/mycolyltransferase Ag85A [Mycobacterium sp. 852014-52144_SCH5372336]
MALVKWPSLRRATRWAAATVAAAMLPALAAGGASPTAQAFSDPSLPIEHLEVPSAAMNRTVRVEFLGAGDDSPALYLLDSMEAGDELNGWDINTQAFDWYDGSGISVVMPVGGKSSFYSDWYAPAVGNGTTYTYKWETFLTQELPVWLASNKGVRPTRNAVVGFSMGGSAALILAAYHPQLFSYAGSLSGFLNLSAPNGPGQVRVAQMWNGGFDPAAMWGPPGDPAWARNDPTVQAGRLAANGTRVWIYCGDGTLTDPALTNPDAPIAGLGFLEGFAIESNRAFVDAYIAAGGNNGVFNFPAGIHSWGYAGQQLQQMKPDIQRVLEAQPTNQQ